MISENQFDFNAAVSLLRLPAVREWVPGCCPEPALPSWNILFVQVMPAEDAR